MVSYATSLASPGTSLDKHASHGDTFKTDDSLYAAYGAKDGLASAMKTYNPMAMSASGPMLDGQKLVGWVGYHHMTQNAKVPHYLPH